MTNLTSKERAMDDQLQKWREALAEFPIESCGRLDMATFLLAPVNVGRIESDVVRYVYFKDGSECIVVGKLADHVAFRAADYEALRQRTADMARAELEAVRLWVTAAQDSWANKECSAHFACDRILAYIETRIAAYLTPSPSNQPPKP